MASNRLPSLSAVSNYRTEIASQSSPSLSTGKATPDSQKQPRKRKGHRGGKKKRSRRKSFAALAEDSHDEAGPSGPGLLYQVPKANLSSTSIDSEALLDHREQKPMRTRRSSTIAVSSPFHNPFSSTPGGSRLRSMHTPNSPNENAEHNPWDETAPLLSASAKKATPTGPSSYGASEGKTGRNRSRRSSRSSRTKRPPSQRDGYDVNHPPSVPGSPTFGAAAGPEMVFGDVMIRDDLSLPSGSGRCSDNEEAVSVTESPLHDHRPEINRRSTVAAAGDVCFPAPGMSELGEEEDDAQSRDPQIHQRHARRRRGQWPDLSVLEEWRQYEKEDRSEERRVKRITEPQLINGRLRPVRKGWFQTDEEVPYRFTYFNEEFQSTIHTEKPIRYGDRPVWWLDVLCPTEAEMKVIAKAFGIHPLTAEDIMLQEAREKVELFRHYYFVNYRTFDQDINSANYLEPVNMYVVVFREGVLSFHFSMTPHPANVRRRIRQLRDYLILSSDWISYAIIDDITDVFQPLIQIIEDEVDEIDENILRMHTPERDEKTAHLRDDSSSFFDSGDMLRRVGDCRKRVMSLYRLLGNKADVIKGFAKRCNESWEVAPRSEIGLYLGDIQDHIVTMTSNLGHYEKILARSHGNYLAQINIRMNERQEQTADVLGKLTVLGTIVLPMNIITGLWGMNVWVPGQEYEGDLAWFVWITAGLLLFGIACYMIAKRVYNIV
ncbi:putative metal iontransporter [Metarhizium anisopliae]